MQTCEIKVKKLKIKVKFNEILDAPFGNYIWPSAYLLCYFIIANLELFRNKKIVELGAGVGIPGMIASKLGCSVVMTDKSDILPNLRECVVANGLSAQVKELDWLKSYQSEDYDYIIGSDLFYDPPLFEPLIAAVYQIFQKNKNCMFITSYHERSSKRNIDYLLTRWGMTAQVIPTDLDFLKSVESYFTLTKGGVETAVNYIMVYTHHPELFHLGKSELQDTQIRNFIENVVKSKRQDGDIWPVLLCKQLTEYYENTDNNGKLYFFNLLGKEFGLDNKSIQSAIQQYQRSSPSCGRKLVMATNRLQKQLQPSYTKLFNSISKLPGGLLFLINLRQDLLEFIRTETQKDYLLAINESLKIQFQEWFGLNNIDLEQLTWTSSALVLEKIIKYEAVHSIHTWGALKQRLGPGRFCFAFFHKSIPFEPLTFVQVATMKSIPENIDSILNDPDPDTEGATVAIFYSITSSKKGLTGVDLGNFLIKRVVKELQAKLPSISTFVTLSPIPNFREWLETNLNLNREMFLPKEIKAIRSLVPYTSAPINNVFSLYLDRERIYQAESEKIIKPILSRLCGRYLLLEKRRNFALDPGFQQSYGMMVNYNYQISEIEKNNQLYLLQGTIDVMEPVQDCLGHPGTKQSGKYRSDRRIVPKVTKLNPRALIPEMQLIDTLKEDLVETCTYLENLQKLIIQQDSDQGILLLERIGRDISLYQHFIRHNESELQEDISFADTSILSAPSRRGSTLGLKHSTSRLSLKTSGTAPEMKDLQEDLLNSIPPGPTGIFRWSSFRELSLNLFGHYKPTVFSVSSGIAVGTVDSKTVLYDLAQNHLATLESPLEYGPVTAIDICPDQTQVVTGFQSGHISLWDIRKRVLVKSIDPVGVGDGNLKGIAITHLAFNSRDVFYSANQQGAAYYHLLYKRLVYSTFKSYRIHGRLKAPDDPELVNTTIFSMSPLLKGKAKFPGDALSLIAVTSPFKLAVLSMKPSPRIQYRVMWSSLNAETSVEYSCTRWWVPNSQKGGTKRMPRLAFSYGKKLGIIHMNSTMESAEDQSKKLLFNFILCLTVDQKFEIYDTTLSKRIESVQISTHRPLENTWDISIPKIIPLHPSPQHNISSSFNRIFIMTDKEICFGSLLHWQERLAVLIRAGNFKLAFQYGIELFEGEYPIVVLGVPVEKEEREQAVSEHLSGLILNLTSMSLSGFSNLEDPSIYFDTATLIIETCISINRLDLIFGDIFERFVDVSLFNIFNSIIQGLILNGTISSVPNPQIIQMMFEQLTQENASRLEQVLLLLDPKTMDLHNTIHLCKEWGFTSALIHVYNGGLMEFGLPVLEIIEKIDSNENSEQELYTLFVYLAYILQGKAFPIGELELEAADLAYRSIFGILCSPTYVKLEGHELRVGKEPWPYLYFLLQKDTHEMLKVAGAVFDNPVLNSGISLQDDKHKDSLLITRHYIINVCFHLIETYSWSQAQVDAIFSFVARSYSKYRAYMNISKAKLMEIFNALVSSPLKETAEERQIAVISLYDGGFIPERQESDRERFLESFRKANFWKLYEKSVLEVESYDLAIESYIADINRKPSLFAAIRGWISVVKPETAAVIKTTIQKHLTDLVDGTYEIVGLYDDLWPHEHQDNIELLKDQSSLQFKYIGGLIGIKKSTQTSVPKFGKSLYDKYLGLMCEIQPTGVLKYLKWLDSIFKEEPYHLELVTNLCLKFKLNRVTIWLLEKSRNYGEVVDLYLDLLVTQLTEVEDLMLDNDQNDNQIKKMKKKTADILADIVRLSELDTPNHQLWLKLLNRICFALEDTSEFVTEIKSQAMEACIAHLPIPKILIHLIESQPTAEFGKYRQLITHLLETTAYQKQTLEIALTLTNSFGFELYREYVQKCKSSFHPSLGQCQLCRRLFHLKAMTIEEQQDKIAIFKCHHAFHSICLVSALEKAQQHVSQDSFEGYELWCIVCGKPSQTVNENEELTKFEKIDRYLEGKPKMSEVYNNLAVTMNRGTLDEIQMNDSFLEEE
ncbi:hypothetical protein HDV01_006108 [Terramyces sp. JEL0728]|nr:hypothetical protein HDV01_006108 [Terramyces sp. JEL0728]